MKTVCEVPGVSRSNLAVKSKRDAEWVDKRKTPARDDMPLVAELQGLVADLPTYGYRRAWALLRRNRDAQGQPRVNAKRVYRVMHTHGLLLERRPRHPQSTRRHDGRVAVDRSNARWCSDGFEFRCDDGSPLRVIFALDCCDRDSPSAFAQQSLDVQDCRTWQLVVRGQARPGSPAFSCSGKGAEMSCRALRP
jgi:putative transposase